MSQTAERIRQNRANVTVARSLLGVGGGVLTYYIAAFIVSVWSQPFSLSNPVGTLAMMLIAGVGVFLAWRWPEVALFAGATVLALVVIAWILHFADHPWPQPSSWTDWFTIWAGGAGSPFLPVFGTVLICASFAGRLPAHRP